MKRLNTEQVLDLMEIIKERHGRQATVIVSQVPVSGGTRSFLFSSHFLDYFLMV